MDAGRIIRQLFGMAERFGQFQLCQHEERLGSDEYGAPQYGTPTPFRAMWLAEMQRIQDADGNEVWSTGRLVVPSHRPITPKGRITLPDGAQPAILQVRSAASRNALIYYEVFF